MFHWFKQNTLKLFLRVPLLTRIADEQYQTDLDLMLAAHNAEEWAVRLEMLKVRKERLRYAHGQALVDAALVDI